MADKYFDINCMVGEWPYYEFHYSRVDELVQIMYEYNIHKAVAAQFEAYRYYMSEGNTRLMAQVSNYKQILPCWVVVPLIAGEDGYGGIKEFFDFFQDSHVQFVKMYPAANGFSLEDWCIGGVLSVMEQKRIPLLISFKELNKEYGITQAAEVIGGICRRHADLPVIVLGFRHNNNRILYYLLQNYFNLYFDISFLGVLGEIESITSRYGSQRLLFGSNMPFFEPGRVIGRLLYSDLNHQDKQAIAFGNLETMIDDIRN